MAHTKEVTYDIGEKVYIPDLECFGYVLSISITAVGTEYQVRYFHDGIQQTAYLFSWELTKEKT